MSSNSLVANSSSPSLHLYSVTLQRPTAFGKSIVGQFSGKHSQDIAVIRGSYLDLYHPDKDTEKVTLLLSHNLFGILRSISSFRIAGSSKDHIIVTSDSGRVAVLDYNPDKNILEQIHLETYGKSGIRRIVPGQYLAVDPKGRAALIASVEKNKLVYVLNRDSAANVTISSPLEAHTPRTIVYDVISVDVGYENPVFAALEVDYTHAESDPTGAAYENVEKKLTFYELDLGLNHVVRKWTTTVDRDSAFLLQVPGPDSESIFPSGVLVGTNNYIAYRNISQPELRVPIPRRYGINVATASPTCIVSGVMHKSNDEFFFLVQTDLGDLFKITLKHDDENVAELTITYFDTIPLAVSLNILKSGFLFTASENSNHGFYRFLTLGYDEGEVETLSSKDYANNKMSSYSTSYFMPRRLTNLELVDEIPALHPVTGSQVLHLEPEQDIPQIYTICGQGANSHLCSLTHGLEISELVASQLPDTPIGVWTLKLSDIDEFHRYIVFSCRDRTLVLSVGDDVEEVTDSGFLLDVSTLAAEQIGQDSIVQVHEGGVRHISSDRTVREWEPPRGCTVTCATTNNFQIAIALSNNSVVYFELDDEGQLNEYEEHKELPSAPVAMSIGKVPAGKLRSLFLAIGCEDSTIRILSLDLDTTLELLAMVALTAPPNDVLIQTMLDNSYVPKAKKGKAPPPAPSSTYLHIGLSNGVYVMSQIEDVTGQLSNTRKRFLGPKKVKLVPTVHNKQNCLLALSSTSWLGFMNGVNYEMTPLVSSQLSFAAGLSISQSEEAIVGTQDNQIKIFSVKNISEKLLQRSTALKYTPKRFTKNTFSPYFYVAESDYNTKAEFDEAPKTEDESNGSSNGNGVAAAYEELDAVQAGHPRALKAWASAVQVVNTLEGRVEDTVELGGEEAAFVIANCYFVSHEREYLVVGTGRRVEMAPRRQDQGGALRVYEYVDKGRRLRLVHETAVAGTPSALAEFQGRLLVGMGAVLSIYELGQKQLLRKAETTLQLNTIVTLDTQGSRIVVGDVRESVTFVVYKPVPNALIAFADDVVSRHVTAVVMLDYDTVLAGDRFGSVFVLRCPAAVSRASDEDEYGAHLLHRPGALGGAAAKLELVAHYFCGDIVTGLARASLAIGGRESVLCAGLQGSVTALVPFVTRKDGEFMAQLERLLRQHAPPASGRSHLVYRGYYAPVKMVVDGDLCEQYATLPEAVQETIAKELERTPRDICRKIDDMRIGSVF